MQYIIQNINDIYNHDINNFYNKLPDFKKIKVDKFKNYLTKKRSIIGEIILEKLCSNLNLNYYDLNFYINKYGKPYLKNQNLFYNISHSFDYVITIISYKEIGVDIEKIRKVPLNIINQIATENEKKYILSTNKNIEERIFKIFTLKEAYFKMLGQDLKNILNIEFKIENKNITCSDKKVKAAFISDVKGYVVAYCEKK